ncbi:MAG: hypothetical protein ACTSUE_09380, partial [Promethearchaeota archaeon]
MRKVKEPGLNDKSDEPINDNDSGDANEKDYLDLDKLYEDLKDDLEDKSYLHIEDDIIKNQVIIQDGDNNFNQKLRQNNKGFVPVGNFIDIPGNSNDKKFLGKYWVCEQNQEEFKPDLAVPLIKKDNRGFYICPLDNIGFNRERDCLNHLYREYTILPRESVLKRWCPNGKKDFKDFLGATLDHSEHLSSNRIFKDPSVLVKDNYIIRWAHHQFKAAQGETRGIANSVAFKNNVPLEYFNLETRAHLQKLGKGWRGGINIEWQKPIGTVQVKDDKRRYDYSKAYKADTMLWIGVPNDYKYVKLIEDKVRDPGRWAYGSKGYRDNTLHAVGRTLLFTDGVLNEYAFTVPKGEKSNQNLKNLLDTYKEPF